MAVECFDLGSCGVHEVEAGEMTHLNVYFEAPAVDFDGLDAKLVQGLRAAGRWPDGARVAAGDVELERDWNETWKQYYRPVWATERIVVHPPWIPVEIEAGQMAIVIDPAMAFGTGGHESTQLALEAIEGSTCADCRCLDIGTGSGVLTIALVQLGAAHVTAVDTDPVVISNATRNLRQNLGPNVGRTQLLSGSIDETVGPDFDLIVANLESHLVRPLLPQIRARLSTGGKALFSGLIETERERFLGWLQEAGFTVDKMWSRNSWFSCRSRPS
ncbi:MAG: 50S ribosomal protein L11 methyltransferase [Candidatus Latescibacteria bacterium]|nr:50S ribosomal protein L11 methyltransferase [Candidatus Latescibacterota bacterium]